mmetsp:Transcript_13852/g.20415  ORF Transcript_13852/g.20415 Transcript_13852/m.20415 type:complete len:145 (-) Transcript_13852:109-543(-)|eukprot:CAMPEP_0113944890 /NCGR_PEP_ID=MMETSP1339-20121228/37571_1 /TAXON_ID=94617 /ORGANISM="Fibrocapsa japonica" /LENGTH=144 /DNA_ID=CAMNT_0000950239 /DNA_START=94 /DNA_END=528 /DNA_ORIENTATION=+ /assembly_acc=CAM_ASM_000762
MSGTLFEDIFDVRQLNPEGKKFDRVNRMSCKGLTYEMELLLDFNCEIYPISEGEKLSIVLASTLNLDGTLDDGSYQPSDEASLADNYEYVMHGLVFKYEQDSKRVVTVTASFGGLLMQLKGDQRHLANITLDQRIYILLRKTAA